MSFCIFYTGKKREDIENFINKGVYQVETLKEEGFISDIIYDDEVWWTLVLYDRLLASVMINIIILREYDGISFNGNLRKGVLSSSFRVCWFYLLLHSIKLWSLLQSIKLWTYFSRLTCEAYVIHMYCIDNEHWLTKCFEVYYQSGLKLKRIINNNFFAGYH